MRRVEVVSVLFGALTAASEAGAQAPSFHLVGLPPGAATSEVRALSADGTVAVGYGNGGFVWTATGGRIDFGQQPGTPGYALGISGDGTKVVGQGNTPTGGRMAFRWSIGAPTFELLGVLNGYARSTGTGASADGSVVVGQSTAGATDTSSQAFRWDPMTGMIGLGFTRPGSIYSTATGISRDGTTICGWSQAFAGDTDAFVYRASTGMQMLPQLPGTPQARSYAWGTNFDGSIIVGESGVGPSATLWRNGLPTDLGLAPGWTYSRARAVSDDGSVVTGFLSNAMIQLAAVWTAARGMEPLTDYLTANGVTLPPGTTLIDAYAVSADGRTIAGIGGVPGLGTQGFVATVPAPGMLGLLGVLAMSAVRRGRW